MMSMKLCDWFYFSSSNKVLVVPALAGDLHPHLILTLRTKLSPIKLRRLVSKVEESRFLNLRERGVNKEAACQPFHGVQYNTIILYSCFLT